LIKYVANLDSEKRAGFSQSAEFGRVAGFGQSAYFDQSAEFVGFTLKKGRFEPKWVILLHTFYNNNNETSSLFSQGKFRKKIKKQELLALICWTMSSLFYSLFIYFCHERMMSMIGVQTSFFVQAPRTTISGFFSSTIKSSLGGCMLKSSCATRLSWVL